jgi:hypothetical protein
MIRKWLKMTLLTILCLVPVMQTVHAASPPGSVPSPKPKAVFEISEKWVNLYWNLPTSGYKSEEMEFEAVCKGKVWPYSCMVSVDGDTFRIRTKGSKDPKTTVYSKELTYLRTDGWETLDYHTVKLGSYGQFLELDGRTTAVRTIRYSDNRNYEIYSYVSIEGWITPSV